MVDARAIIAPQAPLAGGPPLTYTASQVAALLHIGRTCFYQQLSIGAIGPRPFRVGTARRILFLASEVADWIGAGCPPRVRWQGRRG